MSKKTKDKYLLFVGCLSATDKKDGSGSVLQWYGSKDLDPYQNVADQQHCSALQLTVNRTEKGENELLSKLAENRGRNNENAVVERNSCWINLVNIYRTQGTLCIQNQIEKSK